MAKVTVRLDSDTENRLLKACDERACDKSSLVREALRFYVEHGSKPKENTKPKPTRPGNQLDYRGGWIETNLSISIKFSVI